jgi:hypothetical protein
MAVHETAFRFRGDEGMRPTVSIGVACFPRRAGRHGSSKIAVSNR